MRRLAASLALVIAALALAGCFHEGDNAPDEEPTFAYKAANPDEWAASLAQRFLRPMNRNLQVLEMLDNPQTRIYLASGERETVDVINRRMDDLQQCTQKLVDVGLPPVGDEVLDAGWQSLRQACRHYEHIAETVLEAVPLAATGEQEKLDEAEEMLKTLRQPSATAARHYSRALDTLRFHPSFRQILRPSP